MLKWVRKVLRWWLAFFCGHDWVREQIDDVERMRCERCGEISNTVWTEEGEEDVETEYD